MVATHQNFRTNIMFLIYILHECYATDVAHFFQDVPTNCFTTLTPVALVFPHTVSGH